MLIHLLPLDAAFTTLRSAATGLSHQDAVARRLEFGPNRIERLRTTPHLLRDYVLPLDAIGPAIDAIVHGRPVAGTAAAS